MNFYGEPLLFGLGLFAVGAVYIAVVLWFHGKGRKREKREKPQTFRIDIDARPQPGEEGE